MFILLHAFQKNGCIDFPLVFKLSFIQKYLLGMSNLCPQGQPWPGRLLSPPTAAVPCAWHHPARKCATYREQLWCTFLISSHGKSQEQPGLLHPLNETEMPCLSFPTGTFGQSQFQPTRVSGGIINPPMSCDALQEAKLAISW